MIIIIMSPPTFVGRHIVFVLSVCPSHSLSAQLQFHETWQIVRTPYVVVHITRKLWSPKFCGSYTPLNLEISRNLLLKQLVSATPLKLLNRISWNLVGSKDTICSCAYYQEILWELFANTSVISLTETCIYTLRQKLSTTLYFYRYIFLHQYC